MAQKYAYCVPIKYDCIRRAAEGTTSKNENNVFDNLCFFLIASLQNQTIKGPCLMKRGDKMLFCVYVSAIKK